MQLDPFSSSFYQNPANSAMPYLNQIPGTISPYYQPYINAGTDSLASLMGQYQQLINDPSAVMNKLGSGYTQSPGYQFNYNQGMNAANSAAASGGMLGTPMHQQNASNMASNLANQDYNNYINQVQGLYGKGLSGEQGTMQLGYGASNELANSLASNLMNQAGMAYSGQNSQNMANSSMFNQLLGLGSSALGYMGSFF